MTERKLSSAGGRNYGMDALKLFSIYLAIVAHILGGKGPLANARGAGFAMCWLLEAASVYVLNCMGITSGYVSYSDKEKPYRYSKYASRWLQVVFYSLGITLLVKLFFPAEISTIDLIKSALPVSTNHYWYFTAYTGLFFIVPWLNKLIRNCSEKEMNILMVIIFLVFSCYVTLTYVFEPVFHLGDGYSFPWLVILYLVGAWMKKCNVAEKVKVSHAAICFVLSILVNWAGQVFFHSKVLYNHVAPTMLLAAVSISILFIKIPFGPRGKKIVAWTAPASFGVYLAHLNQNAYRVVWSDNFAWIAHSPVLLIPVYVFGFALAIFTVCLLVEKVRIWLFGILKINAGAEKLCENIGTRVFSGLRKIIGA